MTETDTNPLRPQHDALAAEMQAYGELEIVSTFGQPQAEYSAIRNRCALMDWPQRGIIELRGKDRLAFLNNLVTNGTWDKQSKSGLSGGQGVYAFFLNIKGRVICDANILERGDRLLLEVDRRKVDELLKLFERYLFGEQVKVTSRVGQLHEIALLGPQAPAILDELGAAGLADLPQLGSTELSLLGRTAIVWRDDLTATPGYWLIVSSDEVAGLWEDLLNRLGQEFEPGRRRLRPTGWAAFNATRIEAGRPLFGIDFDETVLPAETGSFDRAVSVTKGCYLGQEIVARMHARRQVPRLVVGLRMDDDALPIAGAPVQDQDQNGVGTITSSTMSPALSDAAICLAFVKKGFTAPGTKVTVPAEGSMRQAAVTTLPFIGSGK